MCRLVVLNHLQMESPNIGECVWVHSFVVVNFDLTLGQKVENVFGSQTLLPKELISVACLSFPESSASGDDDLIYAVKIPRESEAEDQLYPRRRTFLYGYVFFRQRKDASITRGYLQKSLVLLARRPCHSLYKHIISIVAPLYYEEGAACLEAVLSAMSQWPKEQDQPHDLPFLGGLISYSPDDVSDGTRKFSLNNELQSKQLQLTSMGHINLHKVFENMLPKLWILYELILLGEPILILSNSPAKGSNIVLQAASLLTPLKYGGDARPYFTIYDYDYGHFLEVFRNQNKVATDRAVILGVTNPLFEKDYNAAHLLYIREDTTKAITSKSGTLKGYQSVHGKCEFSTNYKPLLADTSKETLKKLAKGKGSEISAINNEFLARHFQELTKSFLRPLESYLLDSMIKSCSVSDVWSAIPSLPTLKEEDLVQFLLYEGKSEKLVRAYRNFIHTLTFFSWFKREKKKRDADVCLKYIALVAQLMKSPKYGEVLKSKSEVQLAECVLRIDDIFAKKELNILSNQCFLEDIKPFKIALNLHLKQIREANRK